MQSLFFAIRIFSQFVNFCLFDDCFNRNGLWSITCFSFHTCAATADFSIFYISKVFLNPSYQISFCLSYIYLLAVFAIDMINSWFLFWRNVIFKIGIQKIFDRLFVLRHEYYVRVFEDFVKFIMCLWISKLIVGDILI